MSVRLARCTYYGSKPGRLASKDCTAAARMVGELCTCEQPSNVTLAFFRGHPDEPHDEFYCGCIGWD